MGFFSCNSCGEAVKKNSIEKHGFKCRINGGLSCLDCGKVFGRHDYKTHDNCITEGEKYGGSESGQKKSKGSTKQETLKENLRKFLEDSNNDIDRDVKVVFEKLSQNGCLPLKEIKLKNLLGKNFRVKEDLANRVWAIFSEAILQQCPAKKNNSVVNEKLINGKDKENSPKKRKADAKGDEENSNLKQSKKKKKSDPQESTEQSTESDVHANNIAVSGHDEMASTFKFKTAIKHALKAATDRKMKIKSLEKIIVNEYLSKCGIENNENTKEEAKAIFRERIVNDKFIVEGKFIKLK